MAEAAASVYPDQRLPRVCLCVHVCVCVCVCVCVAVHEIAYGSHVLVFVLLGVND